LKGDPHCSRMGSCSVERGEEIEYEYRHERKMFPRGACRSVRFRPQGTASITIAAGRGLFPAVLRLRKVEDPSVAPGVH